MFVKVCVLDHLDGSTPAVEVYGPFEEDVDAAAFVRPDGPSAEREYHLVAEVVSP